MTSSPSPASSADAGAADAPAELADAAPATPTPEAELEPHEPTLVENLRELILVPARLLGALFLPDRVMPHVVERGRGGVALLACMLAALFSAYAVGTRLDPSRDVIAREGGTGPAPTAAAAGRPAAPPVEQGKSDREIDDDIAKERSVQQVNLGLSAGLLLPLELGLLAIGLFLVGKYVGGKPTLGKTFAAVSYGSLPGAVKACVAGVVALRLPHVTPDEIPKLVQTGWAAHAVGPAAKVAAIADPFTLWSVLLLGFGLSSAAAISRKRGFVTILVCFALYVMLGMVMSGGGQPAPGPMQGGMQ